MAAKMGHEKSKKKALEKKKQCETCSGDMQATLFAGFGELKGMFWVCQGKNGSESCGNHYRTGN